MPTAEDFGVSSETKTNADSLIIGGHPTIQVPVTVVSGQNLSRGVVVGRIDKGAGTTAAVGGNTGNGTMTGTVALTSRTKQGVYTFKCTAAATNSGTFRVTTPTGERLPDAVVGTAYVSDHLTGVTINDGSTDFAVGDSFTVTIAVGSYKWKAFDAANTDGSEVPRGILAHDCDASSGDKLASVYIHGEFNSATVTGDTTLGNLKLQEFGIIVRSAN